jgi:hypothetical protein
MNYDLHLNKYLGKHIDAFGGECVANVAQYCADNGMPIAFANAKDWANHPALRGAFDWTDNNPSDFFQVPKRGDIIVWNGNLPGSGGYGHVAIFDMIVRPGVFQSCDQNWGGNFVHFVSAHTWDYILGWWTPKAKPAPAPEPTPTPPPVIAPHPDPAPSNPPVDENQLEILKTVKENNSLLKQLLDLVTQLLAKITSIFK